METVDARIEAYNERLEAASEDQKVALFPINAALSIEKAAYVNERTEQMKIAAGIVDKSMSISPELVFQCILNSLKYFSLHLLEAPVFIEPVKPNRIESIVASLKKCNINVKKQSVLSTLQRLSRSERDLDVGSINTDFAGECP